MSCLSVECEEESSSTETKAFGEEGIEMSDLMKLCRINVLTNTFPRSFSK